MVEDAAVKGQGKLWIIVTTHGDMGSIFKEARALEGDMKKIEGRFRFKPALTTENIELVLEDRLFKKKLTGRQEIEAMFESRGSGLIRGLGELANVTSRTLPTCEKERFATYYPFFPYQVHLIREIVKTLRSKGGRGEQMSGSTRTLLAITQDILRAGRRRYLDDAVSAIVSFDELYHNLAGEGEISPDVRTELSRVKETVPDATALAPRVAEVLFLIREVPFIPRSKDNIARLLVESVDDDIPIVLARIEPELTRLISAGLVAKIGEEFEFLTGERRTFEEEVTTIEQQYMQQDRERGFEANFIQEPGKNHWRRWLDSDIVTYRDQEFVFNPVIDDTAVSGVKGDVKARVFEMVRTVKNAKIAGADIVPATQLYTEDYMVKFLVQNSLGATWMGMYPESKLPTGGTEPLALATVDGKQPAAPEETEASANGSGWEYYVRDADRAPVVKKPVREITFLDPACGSGHFAIEAFDLFCAMYEEEGELTEPAEICTAILTQNLFDIDARAVQIAEAALWMKAAERVFDYDGAATNLVAATSSHLKGPAWEEFLAGFTKGPSVARVLRKFAQTMEHIDEIGSLARPAEDLRAIIQEEHATWEQQQREQRQQGNILFQEMREDAVRGHLPFLEISDGEFGDELFYRAKAGIDVFTEQARESSAFDDQMLDSETRAGFRLLELLSRRYDVVAANPPYMGSKNFGPALKQHVERHFKPGKRDLYAAFILRDCELAARGCRVAMVTQQSWMFLRSFADLRAVESDKLDQLDDDEFRGVLRATMIVTLAHLGPNAFGEISGEVVNTALFTLSVATPSLDHRLTAFRLVGPKSPEEKGFFRICRG